MLDNLTSMLPLLQMMSGNNNGNLNDMLKNFTKNPDMPEAFKNMNADNNMLSALSSLMSNGGLNDLLKNTGGGGNNNLLSMLPLLQNFMNKKPNRKPEPIIETVRHEPRFYNLKPISKIANKDITYVLNQYFAD